MKKSVFAFYRLKRRPAPPLSWQESLWTYRTGARVESSFVIAGERVYSWKPSAYINSLLRSISKRRPPSPARRG